MRIDLWRLSKEYTFFGIHSPYSERLVRVELDFLAGSSPANPAIKLLEPYSDAHYGYVRKGIEYIIMVASEADYQKPNGVKRFYI